jgi:hypothetical protein
MTMTRMEKMVSPVVTPTRSPYPTVASVAHDQYIDLRHERERERERMKEREI